MHCISSFSFPFHFHSFRKFCRQDSRKKSDVEVLEREVEAWAREVGHRDDVRGREGLEGRRHDDVREDARDAVVQVPGPLFSVRKLGASSLFLFPIEKYNRH